MDKLRKRAFWVLMAVALCAMAVREAGFLRALIIKLTGVLIAHRPLNAPLWHKRMVKLALPMMEWSLILAAATRWIEIKAFAVRTYGAWRGWIAIDRNKERFDRVRRVAFSALMTLAVCAAVMAAFSPVRALIIKLAKVLLVQRPLNAPKWHGRLVKLAVLMMEWGVILVGIVKMPEIAAFFHKMRHVLSLLCGWLSDRLHQVKTRLSSVRWIRTTGNAVSNKAHSVEARLDKLPYSENVFVGILYALVVVNIIIIIKALGNLSVWYDEAIALCEMRMSYHDMIRFLHTGDIHFPLFFCITKTIIDIARHIDPNVSCTLIAKSCSLVPILLLAAVAMTKVRNRWGKLGGAFFAVCVTGAPNMMFFAVEIKMYSWLMFLVTMTFLYAYDVALGPHTHTHTHGRSGIGCY